MRSKAAHTVLTVLMDLLVLLAVVLAGGLVVRFFGALSGLPLAEAVDGLARRLALPLGIPGIKSPYGGTFDVDMAVTILAALFAEWALAGIRRRS